MSAKAKNQKKDSIIQKKTKKFRHDKKSHESMYQNQSMTDELEHLNPFDGERVRNLLFIFFAFFSLIRI